MVVVVGVVGPPDDHVVVGAHLEVAAVRPPGPRVVDHVDVVAAVDVEDVAVVLEVQRQGDPVPRVGSGVVGRVYVVLLDVVGPVGVAAVHRVPAGAGDAPPADVGGALGVARLAAPAPVPAAPSCVSVGEVVVERLDVVRRAVAHRGVDVVVVGVGADDLLPGPCPVPVLVADLVVGRPLLLDGLDIEDVGDVAGVYGDVAARGRGAGGRSALAVRGDLLPGPEGIRPAVVDAVRDAVAVGGPVGHDYVDVVGGVHGRRDPADRGGSVVAPGGRGGGNVRGNAVYVLADVDGVAVVEDGVLDARAGLDDGAALVQSAVPDGDGHPLSIITTVGGPGAGATPRR